MKKSQYYVVTAKCGHVGRLNYIAIEFPVIASSAKQAAAKVKCYSRVKKGRKDAILNVRNVSLEEFSIIFEGNKYDPYLNCRSTHEQMKIENLNERLLPDYHSVNPVYRRTHKERKNRFDRMYQILNKEAMEELKMDYRYIDSLELYEQTMES